MNLEHIYGCKKERIYFIIYIYRKGSTEEYSCVDVATKRAQKKRIEHLEQVLKKLNPTYDTSIDIDPMKVSVVQKNKI